MTPAEQLAAARERVVGPYLPARREWLREWQGPTEFLLAGDGWRSGVVYGVTRTGYCHGVIWIEEDPSLESSGFALGNVRLDVRRPEVRDHLVRRGCPEWARDVPAAVWCWGIGTSVASALERWGGVGWMGRDWMRGCPQFMSVVNSDGWTFGFNGVVVASGPEIGDLGRACADLAALNAGCILRVEGGWLVPMPDGGIGFFPEVSRGS